ncbi:unnamed protein product [Orchesella dallaii]|uniref:DUF243 domain-containing protein n=1 Tax=Orchesella dallaii TaxID=48710 RepID=A0ABP1RI55_9HEXA
MRFLVVFASVLAVGYAGVGQLNPNEEAEALRLFNSICGGGSEGQNIGGSTVYCKRAPGEINESRNHRVRVSGQSGNNQAVFIQPPPARYHHNVDIISGGGPDDRTKIYVLPQQATHTINANFEQTPGGQNKPVVYFLRGGNSESGSIRGPSFDRQSQPSPIIRESSGAPSANGGYSSRFTRSNGNNVVKELEIPVNYRLVPFSIENSS